MILIEETPCCRMLHCRWRRFKAHLRLGSGFGPMKRMQDEVASGLFAGGAGGHRGAHGQGVVSNAAFRWERDGGGGSADAAGVAGGAGHGALTSA